MLIFLNKVFVSTSLLKLSRDQSIDTVLCRHQSSLLGNVGSFCHPLHFTFPRTSTCYQADKS